ncbi:MAG: thioredoxin family protein [Pseudomonadota bacterium]
MKPGKAIPRACLMFFLGVGVLSLVHQTTWAGEMDFENLPAKGMVTMIDLGATKCIPCKMMAPIMAKMEKLYDKKAVIVFIDVWENKAQAKRFEIQAIPTQLFFDETGKEVFRHVGFLSEEAIVEKLKALGVDPPKNG